MTHLDAGAPLRSDSASNGDPAATEQATSSSNRLIPSLVWRRLPWWAELGIIVVGYLAYTRSRVAVPAKERAAYFHASQVWDFERLLHIDIEPAINRAVASWDLLAQFVGYYYGTLHFIITPAVLIWLYVKRPAAYPRLRSTIIITTFAALITFWTWPLAPPRFALAGAVDIGTVHNVMGAGNAHGISDMVNLYAAMPSLHCAWALWCALAVYTTTSGRWRKLVWIYPLATVFVVIGTANHYVLDAVGGAIALGLGWYLTRPDGPRAARKLAPTGSISTSLPVVRTSLWPKKSRDTVALDVEVLDQGADDGTIIDVRRPSAPKPPSTDR